MQRNRKGRSALRCIMNRENDFDDELNRLLHRVPAWARHAKFASRPRAVWLRLPLAIGLMVGGVLGFLPVLGFWMLPLGLALLAIDLPFLRRPLARFLAFINRKLATQTG
jgi:Mg2+/citrate symporter